MDIFLASSSLSPLPMETVALSMRDLFTLPLSLSSSASAMRVSCCGGGVMIRLSWFAIHNLVVGRYRSTEALLLLISCSRKNEVGA